MWVYGGIVYESERGSADIRGTVTGLQTLSGGTTFSDQPSAKNDLKSFDFVAGLRYSF